MTMLDRIPDMTDAELNSLRANATRLSTSGSAKQQTEAATLLPAIDDELSQRQQTKADAAAARKAARPKTSRAKVPKAVKSASEKADELVADIDEAIKRH